MTSTSTNIRDVPEREKIPAARLDLGPLVHLDDPGKHVEGEGALLAADVEGDALVEMARLQRLDPALEAGTV